MANNPQPHFKGLFDIGKSDGILYGGIILTIKFFGKILEKYFGLISSDNYSRGTVLYIIVVSTSALITECGIWSPIGGAYLGGILGGTWAYRHLAMQ